MTIAGIPILGVKWYVKFVTPRIRCVYIDVTDMPEWLKKIQHMLDDIGFEVNDVEKTLTFDDAFAMMSQFTGGGITYESWGIAEVNYERIEPQHKFIGWDYAHDYNIVSGMKSPPTVAEIQSHIEKTIYLIHSVVGKKMSCKNAVAYLRGLTEDAYE